MRIASRCAIDFARRAKAREKVMLSIRQADERDAEAFSEVLCASIRELCLADHNGDTECIMQWTANKTPEHVARWIQPRSDDGSPAPTMIYKAWPTMT